MTAKPCTGKNYKQVPELNQTFGERLRNARELANLTQFQLSEMIGTQRNTVGQWERGNSFPKESESIKALCDVLDTDPNYLFGFSDSNNFNNSELEMSKHTGINTEIIRKLHGYYSNTDNSNYIRLSYINTMLESEYGLKIIDSVVSFLFSDFSILWNTSPRKGVQAISFDSLKLQVSSIAEPVDLTKETIENAFIVSLVSDLRKWKENLKK